MCTSQQWSEWCNVQVFLVFIGLQMDTWHPPTISTGGGGGGVVWKSLRSVLGRVLGLNVRVTGRQWES